MPDPSDRRSHRLFVAFDVPAAAAEAVERAIAPWRGRLPGARWIPRENWHVTLKFLGQTRPGLEPWIRERIAEAAAAGAPAPSRTTSLGRFPSRGRARVLWAGLEDAGGSLARLAGALDATLEPEFAPETRPYTPHLTLARAEPPLEVPPAFAETVLEPVPVRIEAVTLFRSHPGRPVPRYEPLATWPLRG